MSVPISSNTQEVWDFLKENPGKRWTAPQINVKLGRRRDTSATVSSLQVIQKHDKHLKHIAISQFRHAWVYDGPAKRETEVVQPELSQMIDAHVRVDDLVGVLARLADGLQETNKLLAEGITFK